MLLLALVSSNALRLGKSGREEVGDRIQYIASSDVTTAAPVRDAPNKFFPLSPWAENPRNDVSKNLQCDQEFGGSFEEQLEASKTSLNIDGTPFT
jgi:hypothetical protein